MINLNKKRREKAKKPAKFQKLIDKSYAKIDKMAEKLKQIDDDKKSTAINAYVMFESMEGKARAIKAYSAGAVKRCCLRTFCCEGRRLRKKAFLNKEWLRIKKAN